MFGPRCPRPRPRRLPRPEPEALAKAKFHMQEYTKLVWQQAEDKSAEDAANKQGKSSSAADVKDTNDGDQEILEDAEELNAANDFENMEDLYNNVDFHGCPFLIHDDRVVFVHSFVWFRRPASSFGVFGRHAALLRLNMHTWRRVHAVVLLQVLDCDKAQMNMWLCAVARIRPHEATMIIAALDEKCGKILAV